MKKLSVLLVLTVLVALHGLGGNIAFARGGPKGGCTTIQDGVLTYSSGHYLYPQPFKPGYDIFGYNYQARIFNGFYANAYLGRDGFPPYDGDTDAYLAANPDAGEKWYWDYRDVQLVMDWNDAWLSNKDCDKDGTLDRHYGYSTYIGSGAWLTNHQRGSYEDSNGNICKWVWFVKIVAAPSGAYKQAGVWYTADGVEIGPVIWGDFAEIQSVYNDPCGGYHGVEYLSPSGPGFGKW